MCEALYSYWLLGEKILKKKLKRKRPTTEREKADLVVNKIYTGLPTTTEDLQVFVNNSEYIERKLQELLNKEGKT